MPAGLTAGTIAPGGAGDWLGFRRYGTEGFDAGPMGGWRRGVLRGVKAIDLARLGRAQLLRATPGALPHTYHVTDPYDGGEGYWVHLADPQVEPCSCWDFIDRCAELATPCKHILAALLADGHSYVTELAQKTRTRLSIADAVSRPVTDAGGLS